MNCCCTDAQPPLFTPLHPPPNCRYKHNVCEGKDPFLSQRVADQQTHNRQESADSGVGMGSTVYLPIITEDMDTDLDSTLTESNMQVTDR